MYIYKADVSMFRVFSEEMEGEGGLGREGGQKMTFNLT